MKSLIELQLISVWSQLLSAMIMDFYWDAARREEKRGSTAYVEMNDIYSIMSALLSDS